MQRDSSKTRLTDSYFQFVATPAESDWVTTDTQFLLLASRTEVLEVMEPLAPKFGDAKHPRSAGCFSFIALTETHVLLETSVPVESLVTRS